MKIFKKTCSWGLLHLSVSFIVSLIVTHSLTIALSISFLEPFAQIFAFYLHERFWTKEKKIEKCCEASIEEFNPNIQKIIEDDKRIDDLMKKIGERSYNVSRGIPYIPYDDIKD